MCCIKHKKLTIFKLNRLKYIWIERKAHICSVYSAYLFGEAKGKRETHQDKARKKYQILANIELAILWKVRHKPTTIKNVCKMSILDVMFGNYSGKKCIEQFDMVFFSFIYNLIMSQFILFIY